MARFDFLLLMLAQGIIYVAAIQDLLAGRVASVAYAAVVVSAVLILAAWRELLFLSRFTSFSDQD
jgi:hypothetical protein